AHFPFAQPSACPSMLRLPHSLYSPLRGVYPQRAERVEWAPLGMTRSVRNTSIRRGIDSLAPAHSAVRLSHLCRTAPAGSIHAAAQCSRNTNALRVKIFVVVFPLWSELDLFVSSFRVLEDFAFVIPDDDLLVIVIKYVTGIDRHLAPAAGRIDDELRHGITGGVATQAFNDLNAFCDRSTQMRRTVDQVALINVVRTHAAHEKFVHKRLHGFQIVVHAGEQYALISQRDARVGKTLQRLLHFNRQLARMIHMHTHPKRMIFRQHRAQLRCNTLREENRNTRADSQEFYMRNRPQPRKQLVERFVGKNERVAPA